MLSVHKSNIKQLSRSKEKKGKTTLDTLENEDKCFLGFLLFKENLFPQCKHEIIYSFLALSI